MKTLKQITIFSVVILFFNSCQNNNVRNDLNEVALTGKVKSVIETNYEPIEKFGDIIKGEKIKGYASSEATLYNSEGNVIENIRYRSDGEMEYKSIFKFDEKANKIQKDVYNSNKELEGRWEYNYDDKGMISETNIYDSIGKFIRKIKCEYDINGRVIEDYTYNSDGKLEERMTLDYIDAKNKTESIYNANGDLIFKNVYEYDENKTLMRQEYNIYGLYGKDIRTLYTYKYTKYDKEGNWIERIQYNEENIPTIITDRKIEYYQ